MLFGISILGGLLIMMGHQARSEALFYYFRLEDRVLEDHLLRLIDKHGGFSFVREQLKDSYSETGRPSIDPELLLRILLIGYLYGVTSERNWWRNCACIWHGAGSRASASIRKFHTIPRSLRTDMGGFRSRNCSSNCSNRACGSVGKWDWCGASIYRWMAVSWKPMRRRRAVFHASSWWKRHRSSTRCDSISQYLKELEQQNPVEEPVHEQDQVSTTDPDSTYATKGGTPARLGYYDNYLVDNDSCVIVGVQATAARMSQETVAAQDMLTRFAQWQGREPESVAADTTYGNGEFLQWLVDRSVTPYMRTRDSIHRKNSPFYAPERFTFFPQNPLPA